MFAVLKRRVALSHRSDSLLSRLMCWDAAYRSRRSLADLSDSRLADIGVSPAEAGRTVTDAWPAQNWMKQSW